MSSRFLITLVVASSALLTFGQAPYFTVSGPDASLWNSADDTATLIVSGSTPDGEPATASASLTATVHGTPGKRLAAGFLTLQERLNTADSYTKSNGTLLPFGVPSLFRAVDGTTFDLSMYAKQQTAGTSGFVSVHAEAAEAPDVVLRDGPITQIVDLDNNAAYDLDPRVGFVGIDPKVHQNVFFKVRTAYFRVTRDLVPILGGQGSPYYDKIGDNWHLNLDNFNLMFGGGGPAFESGDPNTELSMPLRTFDAAFSMNYFVPGQSRTLRLWNGIVWRKFYIDQSYEDILLGESSTALVITAVPEPISALVLAVGVGVLGMRRRGRA